MKTAILVLAALGLLACGGCSTGASVNTPVVDVGAGVSVD